MKRDQEWRLIRFCGRQYLFSSRWMAGWKQEGRKGRERKRMEDSFSRISGLKTEKREHNTKGKRYAKWRALYAKGPLPPIHFLSGLSFTFLPRRLTPEVALFIAQSLRITTSCGRRRMDFGDVYTSLIRKLICQAWHMCDRGNEMNALDEQRDFRTRIQCGFRVINLID